MEKELVSVCNELLGLLDSHLLPAASSNNEAKVFYLKMKVGDGILLLTMYIFSASDSLEIHRVTTGAIWRRFTLTLTVRRIARSARLRTAR